MTIREITTAAELEVAFPIIKELRPHPADRPYMKAKGLQLIEYTATVSILDNVDEPAAQLFKLLTTEKKR